MKRTLLKRGKPLRRKTTINPIGKRALREWGQRRTFSRYVIKQCRTKNGWRCKRCREEVFQQSLIHAHHIKPKSQGGTNDVKNGVGLCFRCHRLVHDHGEDQHSHWSNWIVVRNPIGKIA